MSIAIHSNESLDYAEIVLLECINYINPVLYRLIRIHQIT